MASGTGVRRRPQSPAELENHSAHLQNTMMTATECPPPRTLLAYSHGRLPDDESQSIDEHLRHCSGCQSELETIRDGDDSLILDLRATDEHGDFADEPDC